MEVTANFGIIVGDGSPNRGGLVARRSGGLVQAEVQRGVQVRLDIVLNTDGSKRKQLKKSQE